LHLLEREVLNRQDMIDLIGPRPFFTPTSFQGIPLLFIDILPLYPQWGMLTLYIPAEIVNQKKKQNYEENNQQAS